MVIRKVRKRTGEIAPFKPEKIKTAIEKAMLAINEKDLKVSKDLTSEIVMSLNSKVSLFYEGIPDIEQIQDTVEEILEKRNPRLYKVYSLYRRSRGIAREIKQYFKIKDDLKLSVNALKVLEERYLLKDEKGNIIETPTQLFKRVAKAIASVEKKDKTKLEEQFFQAMKNLEFLPNSPTLMNAGTKIGQLSACFTGEQPIIASNGIKQIKEIKVGDSVLTASGKFAPVTKTMQRISKGRYIINISKLPNNTLSITEEHPILCLKEGRPTWIMAKDLKEGDYVSISYPKEIQDMKEIEIIDFLSDKRFTILDGFIYRKNIDQRLRSGKISKQVKKIKNKVKVDHHLLRLLGYYASEGDIDGIDCVRLTFSENEINYAKDAINIANDKFGLSSKIEKSNRGKWINVRFHSVVLCQLFENLMGKGFNKKCVPQWILKLPKEKQKGFIIGAFRGDSTLFMNRHIHNAKLIMSNYDLVYAVWAMLMRSGIIPRLSIEKVPKLGTTNPYACVIKPSESRDLMEETYSTPINGPTQISMQRKVERIIGGQIFLPIKNIDYIEEDATVYNFEVEKEHTYVANCVAVHNCFVLPIEDSLESIFTTLKNMALIQQSGGGTGFSFSRLRQKGDIVKSTKGVASGPVSFMRIYDSTTDVIKQGGKRRGANMGILHCHHPDIAEFITAKAGKKLTNFNISVAATDEFLQKAMKNQDLALKNPKDNKITRKVNAKNLFESIVRNAWLSGDPGMIFIDEINRKHPLKGMEKIEATNPCGELPLLPFESCNLGSINLTKMTKKENGKEKLDWQKISSITRLAVHFLDNVIDTNQYPLPEIEKMTKTNRKIGLGIMGFADLLLKLKIPYDSSDAVKLGEKIISFISKQARQKSIELGKQKGSFPNFKHSKWKNYPAMRNATLTTIAPTGTISIIANCSSGIEPLFALAFLREVLEGKKLIEINEPFKIELIKRSLWEDGLIRKITKTGSIKGLAFPKELKKNFVTSLDISPEWHVKIQAAFQKHVDNAVSKTVNLPKTATQKDVEKIYLLAWKLRCKGITIYRYGSKEKQVLYKGTQGLVAKSTYAGGCPTGICPL